ncbi:MAG: hypothetical protein CML20_17735 [Rheinheimera sp.]|uniref:hypothetical protein n=1 Tax=Arsukibacterium sp. UBA3155 TaxID=1946058 RepID=UPI000C9461C7|nr:hypothetical protein [Arsukibacterium sp. UBA3155]MAD76600.1 hypothetical protein [Rheinheimera sp.]|tara:strand:- start:16505 stop:16942 length:438 start_codon:yes stop_codon:yes gene_type:complete
MILTMPFNNNTQVNFEPLTGNITAEIDDALTTGILHHVAGHNIALYAEDNKLKLQIDSKIWHFAADKLNICYQHNPETRTTQFDVTSAEGKFSVEYPAWWAAIPNYQTIEPEQDPDEDFLAYLCQILTSATIQQSLLHKWSELSP